MDWNTNNKKSVIGFDFCDLNNSDYTVYSYHINNKWMPISNDYSFTVLLENYYNCKLIKENTK